MDQTGTGLRYRPIIAETGHQVQVPMDVHIPLGSESGMRLLSNKMGIGPGTGGRRPLVTVRMKTETLSWMTRRVGSHNGLVQCLIRKDHGCCRRDEMGRGGAKFRLFSAPSFRGLAGLRFFFLMLNSSVLFTPIMHATVLYFKL